MNQTLKKQITKLILETRLPWTKCLPIALLWIRTAPRKNIELSTCELLYGMPKLGKASDLPTMETKYQFFKNYILGLSSIYSFSDYEFFWLKSPALSFQHPYWLGDYILIKTWKENKLDPTWEGTFQVLFITETALWTVKQDWTHYTRVKSTLVSVTAEEEHRWCSHNPTLQN
jgi:hypothetical protein